MTEAKSSKWANQMDCLANILGNLGRREAALAVAEDAVQQFRALSAARPKTFPPAVAMARNNLANRLHVLGRLWVAVEAAEDVAAIRRELAAVRPDALRSQLAVSLSVLAKCLESCDRPGDALQASAAAVEVLAQPFLQCPARSRRK